MTNYDVEELRETIIKALEYYDNKNESYKYIHNQSKMKYDNITLFDKKGNVYHKEYEIIGKYDNTNNIWIWGWLLPYENKKTSIARYLLEYGLQLDVLNINSEQLFIKSLLTNSRYIVNDIIGLEINIAIFSYLLKDKISFIYPYKNNDITIYCALYN